MIIYAPVSVVHKDPAVAREYLEQGVGFTYQALHEGGDLHKPVTTEIGRSQHRILPFNVTVHAFSIPADALGFAANCIKVTHATLELCHHPRVVAVLPLIIAGRGMVDLINGGIEQSENTEWHEETKKNTQMRTHDQIQSDREASVKGKLTSP